MWRRVKSFISNSLKRRQSPHTGDRDSLNYFKLGTQYYVAGRFGTFAGFLPASGNLFHHAVEMFLKGDLCQTESRVVLKSYGHRLKRLWKAYKRKHQGIDLAGYDKVISQLEKFERIRYPDDITDRGLIGAIAISGSAPIAERVTPISAGLPRYSLIVNNVDDLVRAIFEATSRNPSFFFTGMSTDGKAFLYKDNTSFTP